MIDTVFMPARWLSALSFFIAAQVFAAASDQGTARSDLTSTGEFTLDPGPGWSLVWADEFDGPELNGEYWNRQIEPPGRFNEEWQRYTGNADNAFIEDGHLVIRARHHGDRHGKGHYSSARLNTASKQTWRYGRFAARIRLPDGKGMWPAFWMLGANIDENGGDTPWPQCGEIDILEFYGSKDHATVEANIHYAGADGKHRAMGAQAFKLTQGKFSNAFHVFEIEWTERRIAWFVDGQEYAAIAITDPVYAEFHEAFFLLLNLAVGGAYAGRPDASTAFPQEMLVDWIRVYQRR